MELELTESSPQLTGGARGYSSRIRLETALECTGRDDEA